MFEAGAPSHDGAIENNIFVGGLRPVEDIEINSNHTFLSSNSRGNSMRVGYYQQENKNIYITNNYITGGSVTTMLRYVENLTFMNNTVIGNGTKLIDIYADGEDLSTWGIDSNLYYYGENELHL